MIFPSDPNERRKHPRLLRAVTWRLPLEISERYASATFRPFSEILSLGSLSHHIPERGMELENTSVTQNQKEMLLRAVRETETFSDPIVEIGSWRGATTAALAAETRRIVYAVDPYSDSYASEPVMNEMLERTKRYSNVTPVRATSGEAAIQLARTKFSLIFIDGIHDYINAWFDFTAWSNLLVPGGILAFHDVDDHAGTNLACRRVLKRKDFEVWGYCPNMLLFRKRGSPST